MMKSSFKMLVLLTLLIGTNIFAKSDHTYYDLETKECRIAIPTNFYILGGFTKKRIVFFHKKESSEKKFIALKKKYKGDIKKIYKSLFETKSIEVLKGNYQRRVSWLKNIFKNDGNILVDEKKIGHLLYLKYKVPLANNITEYQYNIFGKSFFIGCTNVDQEDIDYMIKHCNETYNEDINTSK